MFSESIIARDSIIVTSIPKLLSGLAKNIGFCNDGSVVLDAGIRASSYLWSTGAITPKIMVNDTGKYIVQRTNLGCILFDTSKVTEYVLPRKLTTDTAFYHGKTITLKLGEGLNSYLWSTGEISPTIMVNQSGQYILKMSYKGCLDSGTINIREYQNETVFGP